MKSDREFMIDDLDLGYGGGLLLFILGTLTMLLVPWWWIGLPFVIAAFALCWWFG